jgi:quercetin dioxygenase-like cupin family protein
MHKRDDMNRPSIVMTRGSGETLRILGTDVRFLCTGDNTGRAWSLMEAMLPKNAGPPPHDHPWDEAYYVVEGSVRFVIDGAEKLVSAGDFIYAPGGVVHGFQGASESPARMLVFDAPAHTEAFFRELDRQVKEPRDLPKVAEIGERHQVRFAQAGE